MMKKILALCLVLCFTNSLRAQDWVVLQNKPPMTKEEMAKAIAERKPFVNSLGMEFIWIEPGTFSAGADYPADEELYSMGEAIAHQYTSIQVEWPHEVKIKKGFYLAAHETSWKQLTKLIQPEKHHPEQLPEEPVWELGLHDAIRFIETLNQKEKPPGTYRFPKHLEWEYACKAGREEPPRKEGQPHYEEISESRITPNPWGIYALTSEPMEWTSPFQDPTNKNPNLVASIPRGIYLSEIHSISLTCSSYSSWEVDAAGLRLVFEPK